ncbi:MAG: arylsulfatase [Bryobacteraceae bacterium]
MTRRSFLTTAAATKVSAAPKPPNIVLVMADDMGYSDLACYGSEIPTPHLDALARDGIRFTQFYNAARCCPTRASLLTGLYPHQAGIGHMGRNLGLPAYQGFLNDRCATLAEVLRDAGYRTVMVGKWHVGARRGQWPCDRGFDQSYALLGGTSDYFHPKTLVRGKEEIHPSAQDYYITDDFTRQAVQMLEQPATTQRPFFLYLAYTAPHFPIQAPAADIARNRGRYTAGWEAIRHQRYQRMRNLGIVNKRWELSPRPSEVPPWNSVADKAGWDTRMATYAAMIERLDAGVGQVRQCLSRIGAASNTLFLFLSDNGACAESKENGAVVEPPWANVSNTPFRKYKHWAHEGGISTPLIASWPARIRNGALTTQLGHVTDIMPTLLEASAAQYPASRIPLPGTSLMKALRGERLQHPALFWEHEGNRAIRHDRWKLVAGFNAPWELYDMANDRTELHDLATLQPRRVHELTASYNQWAQRCGVVNWREDWERNSGIPL